MTGQEAVPSVWQPSRRESGGLWILAVYGAVVVVGYLLAFVIRFDLDPSLTPWAIFARTLPVVLAFRFAALLISRLHRAIWWRLEIDDLVDVLRATTAGSLAFAGAVLVARSAGWSFLGAVPIGVLLLDWTQNVTLLVAARMVSHQQRRRDERREAGDDVRRVLIVGAGEAGIALASQMAANPRYRMLPVAFVDDNAAKVGSRVSRVPVAATCDRIPEVARQFAVDQIVIAIPSASGLRRRQIVEACEAASVPFRTLPSLPELLNATIRPEQIREVDPLDLLGRPVARIEPELLAHAVAGKTVLVTGAAGSVGGELAQQIAHLRPRRLVLIDRAETPLLFQQTALREAVPGLDLFSRIVDATDGPAMARLLQATRPDVVFHAAAHKHVPLMEDAPREAVRNNVGGTLTVAEQAEAAGVDCFVFISTDKAVRPSSVMGATKRLAELALQDLARTSRMRIVTVRFGNVLGSNGSVVPIFREQIRQGGPVTVTDRGMERYFMALPEAAALILEAAAFGASGQVLLLDMGEPVRIVQLAEAMIRLSGLRPHADIGIRYTGVRPGEKLQEELQYEREEVVPSPYEKLLVLRSPEDGAQAGAAIRDLLAAVPHLDDADVARRLWALVDSSVRAQAVGRSAAAGSR